MQISELSLHEAKALVEQCRRCIQTAQTTWLYQANYAYLEKLENHIQQLLIQHPPLSVHRSAKLTDVYAKLVDEYVKLSDELKTIRPQELSDK